MRDSHFNRMLPPGFILSLLHFSKDQPHLRVRDMKVEPALGCSLPEAFPNSLFRPVILRLGCRLYQIIHCDLQVHLG